MRRKEYSRSSVESQTVFEQTSPACNATEYPVTVAKVEQSAQLQFPFGPFCDRDVSKGGNRGQGERDAVPVEVPCLVVLS